MNDIRSRFPGRLKQIRLSLGLNQADMASKIGVSRAAYSMYETGKNLPDIELIDTLYQVTGYPFDYIMGYTDNTTEFTAGLDKELGLSTTALEKLAQHNDIQAVITHLLEDERAHNFARFLCYYGTTSTAWEEEDGSVDENSIDVVIFTFKEAALSKANALLKEIFDAPQTRKALPKPHISARELLSGSKEFSRLFSEVIKDGKEKS